MKKKYYKLYHNDYSYTLEINKFDDTDKLDKLFRCFEHQFKNPIYWYRDQYDDTEYYVSDSIDDLKELATMIKNKWISWLEEDMFRATHAEVEVSED